MKGPRRQLEEFEEMLSYDESTEIKREGKDDKRNDGKKVCQSYETK